MRSPENVRFSVHGWALEATRGDGVGVGETDTCCSSSEQPLTTARTRTAAAMPARRVQGRGMYVLPW